VKGSLRASQPEQITRDNQNNGRKKHNLKEPGKKGGSVTVKLEGEKESLQKKKRRTPKPTKKEGGKIGNRGEKRTKTRLTQGIKKEKRHFQKKDIKKELPGIHGEKKNHAVDETTKWKRMTARDRGQERTWKGNYKKNKNSSQQGGAFRGKTGKPGAGPHPKSQKRASKKIA